MTKILRNFALALLVLSFMAFTPAAHAWHLIWDTYTDTDAEGLRVYRSVDQTFATGTTTVDLPQDQGSFPTTYDLGAGPGDGVREYFKMTAYYTDANSQSQESPPTPTISLYWTSGGGGTIYPVAPGGVKLVVCDNPDDLHYGLCPGP